MVYSYAYCGDFSLLQPVQIFFNTRNFTTGVPTSLLGSPSVALYVSNDPNEITTNTNLFVDFDGKVGLNRVGIALNAAVGFIPATYHVVLLTGTVGGISVAGTIIGSFSMEQRSNIRPIYQGGQTLALDANGVANANLINVAGTPQTAGDIIARLPAALISGRMDSNVGAMAANTLTASALATDAVNEIQAGLATSGSVAGLATAAALATVQADTDNLQTRIPAALIGGRMDASVGAMATDVLTASALAADAVLEIQTGITFDVSGLATAAALATVQADTDNIQTRLPLALIGGRMDSNVSDMEQGIVDHINYGMASQGQVADVQSRLPLALVNGRMNSSVGAMAPDTLTASALAADAVAEIAAAMDAIATATEIADAILRRNVAGGSDGVRTVSEALYALRNKTEIVAGFLKVYQTDDATVAWQGAVTTAPGDPLTSIDPA